MRSTSRNGERWGSSPNTLPSSATFASSGTGNCFAHLVSSGLLRDRRPLGRRRAEIRRSRRAGLPARARYPAAGAFADRAYRHVHRVVTADYLVGNVDARSTPQDRSLLHHHRVAVTLSKRADDLRKVMHDFRRDRLVLGLQLVLRVLVVALEVLELFHVLVLQTLALILVHQHALFLHLVLKGLDLILLPLQAPLHRCDTALEFGLGPLAGVALIERSLHVNIRELQVGVRGNRRGRHRKERTEQRTDEQPLPHTAWKASC